MDEKPLRHVTQREHRRFRCPCSECGNLFYQCPFNIRYQLGGPLPVFEHACEEPIRSIQPNPGRVDPDDYSRVVTAYRREYRACISGPTYGVSMAKNARRLENSYRTWYASPAICKATQRALMAYGHLERDPASAVAGAEAALAISSTCPDAYWLLARFRAKSYEEALELYEKGYAEYDKKLLSNEGRTKCAVSFGECLADAPPYQGAVRCAVGAINVLCRMRRGKEAYDKMQGLLRVTSPISEAPFADVWNIAPEVVYRGLGPAACLSWLQKHMCMDVMEGGGAAVWWLATYALAWVATHLDEGFRWSSVNVWEDETRVGSLVSGSETDCDDGSVDQPRSPADKLRNGLALAVCCCWLPHLVDMLLGDMPLPPDPLPPMTLSVGSIGCQVAYARYCGDMWRDTPGVLDYVRRYRNTYEVFGILCDARTNLAPSLKDLQRYLYPDLSSPSLSSAPALSSSAAGRSNAVAASSNGRVGGGGGGNTSTNSTGGPGSTSPGGSASGSSRAACIFPDGVMYEVFGSWCGLVDAVCLCTTHIGGQQDATMTEQHLEILRMLLGAECPVTCGQQYCVSRNLHVDQSPIQVAMSVGYGPDAVRELVKAGADPFSSDATGCVPVLGAAEQGMWRELQAVLKVKRKMGSKVAPLSWGSGYLRGVAWDTRVGPSAMVGATMFEVALVAAVSSSCAPCLAGAVKGCFRCIKRDATGGVVVSPHSPGCNFTKVLEVLVAYGMTSVSERIMQLLRGVVAAESSASVRAVRQDLFNTLQRLLQEEKERQSAAAAGPPEAKLGGGGAQGQAEPTAAQAQAGGQPNQGSQARQAQDQGRQAQAQGYGEAGGAGGQQAASREAEGHTAARTVANGDRGPQQQQRGQKQLSQAGGEAAVVVAATAKGAEAPEAPEHEEQHNRESQNAQKGLRNQQLPQPYTRGQEPRQENVSENGEIKDAKTAAGAAAEGVAASGGGGPQRASFALSSGSESGRRKDRRPVPAGPLPAASDAASLTAVSEPQVELAPHHDRSHCWACGKEKDRAAGVKMRKCSQCATARYCGEACQREHWPSHRPQCKLLAAIKAPGRRA